MKFGAIPPTEAEGAILAHALTLPGRRMKKGRVLDRDDLAALEAAGIAEVIAARLEAGDVAEDAAATRAAAGLPGPGIKAAAAFTGRVNLHAEIDGILAIDHAAIDRLNGLDEAVTLATLPSWSVVRPGTMVATIKVIPFAAPETVVRAWENSAPPLRVAAFRPHRAGLVQTRLPSLKPSVMDKTAAVTAARLVELGSTLALEERCAHDEVAVAAAIRTVLERGASPVLVSSASAIIDRRDVVPSGIVAAGGEITGFGMPVDPGNLLLLGRIGGVSVVGLPGCARSRRLNGFDWVLRRLLAGLEIGPAEIARMGVGGLLAETPSRGLPREPRGDPAGPPRVAALVLAAGRASRMGANKLLLDIGGKSLVQRAVEAALQSGAAPVVVVLGHEAAAVRARLADYQVRFVTNPAFADGLSTSLKAGLAALPDDADGVVVCLGDMPDVEGALIARMIAAFNPLEGRGIVVPVRRGRRGNPVLWGRRFLSELTRTTGDTGAKHLIGEYADQIVEIEAGSDGVLLDLDTPESVEAYRARRITG